MIPASDWPLLGDRNRGWDRVGKSSGREFTISSRSLGWNWGEHVPIVSSKTISSNEAGSRLACHRRDAPFSSDRVLSRNSVAGYLLRIADFEPFDDKNYGRVLLQRPAGSAEENPNHGLGHSVGSVLARPRAGST